MASRDPRIDAYIAKAAPFARPLLRHVRKLVHQGCPEVEETMKWSMPHFEYHGIMLGMAAFKEHCSIGFWKGELVMGKRAGSNGEEGRTERGEDVVAVVPAARDVAAQRAEGVRER